MENNPDIGLRSYDRFFPNQDTLPKGGFGNLIALPLQKQARLRGNSVFLDAHFEPHADQWAFLAEVRRITRVQTEAVVREADRRGPGTALTSLLLKFYGVAKAQDLIHQVYHGTLRPSAIASLAKCVQSAFTDGDAVAIGILRAAVDELESCALSVARRIAAIRSVES